MAVGAVRRYGAVLGAFAAHVRRVVRVEIQEQPARFQHPVPLGVGFLRFRQRPRQIPAEHDIEGAVREIQLLGIHMPEGNVQPKARRHGGGFLQHGGGQVDARHRMSQLRHENGKKSGAGAHVQNVQRRPFRQPRFQFFLPAPPHDAPQFVFPHGSKVMRPYRPVAYNPIFNGAVFHDVLSQVGFPILYPPFDDLRSPPGGYRAFVFLPGSAVPAVILKFIIYSKK